MTKRISKGTCALCQGEFSRASVTKHLQACQRRATDAALPQSADQGVR